MKVTNQLKTPDRKQQNKNDKNYTFWGNCCKCGKFGLSVKEYQRIPTVAIQDKTFQGQTIIQTKKQIRYPTLMSPARLPVLTQQITADLQLSQEVKMAETNKLLKRATKNTYKKLTSILKQPPKKTSNTTKTPKKVKNKNI